MINNTQDVADDIITDEEDLIDSISLLQMLEKDSFVSVIIKDNIDSYIDRAYCNQLKQK